MKKILIIIAAFFIVGNTYAQTWLPGPPLRIKDGTDTIDVNGVFSKYTGAFLKYIKGNVGISTNTHDSVLVYDDFTRSIKKKLIAGGGVSGWSITGNAGTNPTNNFIGTTDYQPFKIRVNNDVVATFGVDKNIQMGLGSIATNNYSTAIGGFNSSAGFGATSFGYASSAAGAYSVATGFANIASGGGSFATGTQTEATGENSTSFGVMTKAKSYGETAIGLFNTSYTPTSTTAWSATDRLFGIGNGTGTGATSDAFTVLKNGNVGIGITVPTSKLHVAGGILATGSITSNDIGYFQQGLSSLGGTLSGFASFASGTGANASNSDAIALGQNANASGEFAIAGSQSTASGRNSTALSTGTAKALGGFATGQNNTADAPNPLVAVSTDRVFQVGAGGSNVITTLRNGNTGFGLLVPTSTIMVAGSIATTLVSTGTNYTATAVDNTINVTTAAVTITLPTAVGIQGREYTIINSTSGNITITTTASQTIGNFVTTTSFTLATDKALKVQSDNTNYKIKGQY